MGLVHDKDDLASVLMTMPFGQLIAVAKELVEMNEDTDCDRNVKTPLGMAQTLYDWAESKYE